MEICNLHLDLPDGLRTSFIIAIVGYIRNLYSLHFYIADTGTASTRRATVFTSVYAYSGASTSESLPAQRAGQPLVLALMNQQNRLLNQQNKLQNLLMLVVPLMLGLDLDLEMKLLTLPLL